MNCNQTLAGKVALVTGGSRGIGEAIVRKLAACGADVVINYSRSADRAAAIVQEIIAAGGKASTVGFDVANSEAVSEAINTIVKERGGLHILVNNAGITSDGLLIRTKDEDWQRTIDVNLSGSFYCARAAAKAMMKQRDGRIINMSSVIGESGNAGQAAYAASKAGVIGLTKSLAKELASRSVTVNAITPGYIETEMTAVLSADQTEGIQANIPLGRLGQVDDIAEAVAYIASPAASYVTGQVLGVNGGMYM